MAKSPHLSRSDFVKTMVTIMGGVIGVAVGLPGVGYLIGPFLKPASSDAWVPLGPLETFPVGAHTPANFTRTSVNGWESTSLSFGLWVYRKSETDFIVFSSVCTHLACRVKWQEENKVYHCPCHDAEFGPEGEIIKGPQSLPLNRYEHKVENNQLLIHFKKG